MDYEGFRGQFAEGAEKEVKIQLVIEKIAQVENVQASDEDLDEEVKRMADLYKQSAEELMKSLSPEEKEYVKKDIAFRKTIKLLVQNAKLA